MMPWPEPFWPNVDRRGPDECWPWKLSIAGNGYGQTSLNKRRCGTHRAAWILTYGPIPPGLQVCHRCDNPPCCNPAHLFLGTPHDNAMDKSRKRRIPQQLKTHCPKGHPYDEENTRSTGRQRFCRACARAASAKRLQRLKDERRHACESIAA